MHLSRIRIENFRNFKELDVKLGGNAVIVGENRVGKSNLLFATRLIFDPSLPDSARQLSMSDFSDLIEEIDSTTEITVSVEIRDFEGDADILAVLTDFRLDHDPDTVRLTYKLKARPDVFEPATDDDFIFVCFGGEDEAKRFGHELRRRITMDVLPALRDAEGDLAVWRRSPLRPLVEDAFLGIDRDDLAEIGDKISEATQGMIDFPQVKSLTSDIATLFLAMSGPKQDVKPSLGFSATDAMRINRQIRLLIDEGRRGISDASLGSANLIFLTLKLLGLQQLIDRNRRDHSLLAIEEPESHLHPHLQRLVYKHLFETVVEPDADGEAKPLSVILTTHSPHIASVAPLSSILLLRDHEVDGTRGYSLVDAGLSKAETDDLARYLDVTRAEIVFARGVVLVEGDAERFLVPAFAQEKDVSLDEHGITVCSVAGTNFIPYAKLLCGLGIPFSIITDRDQIGKTARAYNRGLPLIDLIDRALGGGDTDAVIEEIEDMDTYEEAFERFEEFGIFVNAGTLETDLFLGDFPIEMIETLREGPFGKVTHSLLNQWEADVSTFDAEKLLAAIERMGKGRFAQRLATRIAGSDVPEYISKAIDFVVERV